MKVVNSPSEALDLLKAGDYSSLDVEAFRCPLNQAGKDLVLADKYFIIIIMNTFRCFVNHAAKGVGNDKGALREDVEEEEEDKAEQDKALAEEEEEEEEKEHESEQDRGLEGEKSDGVYCDSQDRYLATRMKKGGNGTNGIEAGADSWSCDQNPGEEQCLGDGEEDEMSLAERVEDVDGVEDDEEDCSEGGEVDHGNQEVADVELGVDEEEHGADEQGAEVGYEELGVDEEEVGVHDQDEEVDDEEQGVDQQQDDEIGDEENLTEDEKDQRVTEEEGQMNFELKEESLEENEPKSEEHNENSEEHKLQETNAFEEERMDGAEDLKKKNKTIDFELAEAGLLLENEKLITSTTSLATCSMASTTSTSSHPAEEKNVDHENGESGDRAGVELERLDQEGNLKTDSKECDVESSSEVKKREKEVRGPILMFNTLGKNDEEVEEITDEENEVMELETEVEELDCALQKKIEDKNKQLDHEDEEEDVDEELEDKDR